MLGPIGRFLAADHARLAALAARLVDPDGTVDLRVDDELRCGLLRHLDWEERVLIRLAQSLREGEPLPFTTRVRVEHRAIRALLVPTPTRTMARTLAEVLAAHEATESASGGFYDVCDTLASSDADAVVDRLRALPEPVPMPHDDGSRAFETMQRLLTQAGFRARGTDE